MTEKQIKVKKKKKPIKNKWYLMIHIPILSIILILVVIINFAADYASSLFDTFIMSPSQKIVNNQDVSYYEKKTDDPEIARENAQKVALEATEEGEVLLKNNGVLPLDRNSKLAPFGYAFLNPAYSGTGAGAADGSNNISPEDALSKYFEIDNSTIENMKNADVESLIEADGTTPALITSSFLSNDSIIYQYPASVYEGTDTNIKNDDALVFITRQGNEGADKKLDGYKDGTPHYLALTNEEKETIKFAKDNCKDVIVVIVSSNPMELTPLLSGNYEADAILWIGNPGSQGFKGMAEILAGEVNPSGRLVDTYASDFTKDPTYANMGIFTYANGGNESTMPGYYIEYQEGIYSGYRYYETADEVDDNFVYGTLDENGAFIENGAVCYPFGYGLSYTTFSKEITDFSFDGKNINMSVKVTNTGKVAGKDCVQIYYTSPYTQYDIDNRIEKSTVELIDFGKTKELASGESETINIIFSAEDMASYSFLHENSDGTKGCYILESGEYDISLRNNSHDIIESKTITIDETVVFEGDTKRDSDVVTATNQFQDSNDYMMSESVILTRSDWANTKPQTVLNRTKEISSDIYNTYLNSKDIDVNNDPILGNQKDSKVYSANSPTECEDNDLYLSDLRGKDYDDSTWDLLLNQLDLNDKEVLEALYGAAYQVPAIKSIGKSVTTEQDGDMGLKIMPASFTTCSWPSKPVVASTWNKELAYKVGEAFGQEALTDGLNGWYAPGMNIHRSPFAGRNLEYFSEDGVLSGKLASGIVSGAADNGLVCYIKHFAVNDQENNREYYLNTWADEQTMRQIYLKPFEICIKEAKMNINYTDDEGKIVSKEMPATLGLMSAQSCIGTTICIGHYGLLTGVLRNEWGFKGVVITDLYMTGNKTLPDQMLRAGGDTFLAFNIDALRQVPTDITSSTAKTAIRNSLHHLLYAYVNSGAYNNLAPGSYIKYGISKLFYLIIALDIVVALLFIFRIAKIIKRVKKYSAI